MTGTHDQWLAANPLLRWRTTHGLSRSMVASRLGVNINTPGRWELGVSHPHRTQFSQLADLTGIKDIEQQWEAWWQARPAPHQENAS